MFRYAALFLLCAHVAYEIAKGERAGIFAPAAAAAAAADFVARECAWWTRSSLQAVLMPALVVAIPGAGFAALGVFDVYAAAYATAPLILVWLQVLHAHERWILYDPSTVRFVATRSASYAALRALGRVVCEAAAVPRRIERLIPLAAASMETMGMMVALGAAPIAAATGSIIGYTFDGPALLSYATLKSAVFVLLPILEDLALERAS